MSKDDLPQKGQATPPTSPAQAAREGRLAKALRDNLRRRKASAPPKPPSAGKG